MGSRKQTRNAGTGAVRRIRNAALLPLLAALALAILGLATAPPAFAAPTLEVLGASVQSTTKVKISFNASVGTSGEDVANYTILPALAVTDATRTDSNHAVTLTTAHQLNGVVYEVTVTDVRSSSGGTMRGPESMRFIGTLLGARSLSVSQDDFNRPSGVLRTDSPISGPWYSTRVDAGNSFAIVSSPTLRGGYGDGALWSYVSNTDGELDNACLFQQVAGSEYFLSAYVYVPSGQNWEPNHAVGLMRVDQSMSIAHARVSAFAQSASAYTLKVNFKSTDNLYHGEQLVATNVPFDSWHWLQMRVKNSPSAGKPGVVQVWLDGRLRYQQDTIYVSNRDITYAEFGIMHNVTTASGPPSTTVTDQVRMGTGYQLPSLVTDTAAPSVAVGSPSEGATLRGSAGIAATASDDVDVQRVEFLLDGAVMKTDDVAPFATDWDTTGVADGRHEIVARAYDTSGNATDSGVRAVTVDNTQATIGSPAVAPTPFSPNGDGVDDVTWITFVTGETAAQRVTVRDSEGSLVKTLLGWTDVAAGEQRLSWDGSRDKGPVAPDGDYLVRIEVQDKITPALPVAVTELPVRLTRVLSQVESDPTPFSPNDDGTRDATQISYALTTDASVAVAVTTPGGTVVRALRSSAAQGSGTYTDLAWDGRAEDDSLSADGDYVVRVTATSAVGTVTQTFPVVLDATAPATSDDAPVGWQHDDVTVTLEASDATTEVVATEYRVDGATAWSPYKAPIAVVGDAQHTLEYRSTDAAGNAEVAKTATVLIDATPPITASDADGLWHGAPVTVTFAADDAASGVQATYFRVTGGDWQVGTEATVGMRRKGSPDGANRVSFYSVDEAGNVEAERSAVVWIDTTAPLTADDADGLVHDTDTTVTLYPWDAGAGLAATYFRVDEGAWQPGTAVTVPAPADHSNDGLHVIDYYSVDLLGNVEVPRSCWMMIAAPSDPGP